MNFNDMTVRGKLGLTFGALALLTLVVSGLSVKSLGDANKRFSGYVNGINERAMTAAAVRTAVDRRALAARNLVLVTKPEDLAAEKAAVDMAHEDVQRNLAKLNKLMADAGPSLSPEVRSKIENIDKVEQSYGPIALAIVKLAIDGKHEAAIVKMNSECRPMLAALVKATDDYQVFTAERAKQLTDEAEARYATQRNILIAVCLIAFAAAGAAGALITRSLTRELGSEPGELSGVAQRVAGGDLSPVEGADRAPVGSVLASLGAMQMSLSTIVGQVRNSSDSIATGSAEIATGNADLSQRTEEQASNLQQTAASMEQLSSTVRNNAESAGHANSLASNASAAAAKGGEMVGRVVTTMQDIAASSRKISDIIGVIDGIAFQTNILALNAAVEAARAGEQGRGFAVVAGEVRTLASRSAEAAKEIKSLISASVEKVQAGTTQADDAGDSMEEIVAQVKRVSDLISEISNATQEQSTGISQVGDAVSQLDQVTQQNAALVEEGAAAAESLRHQAANLAKVVSVFKLSGDSFTNIATGTSSPAIATASVTPRFAPVTDLKRPAAILPKAKPMTAPAVESDDWSSF